MVKEMTSGSPIKLIFSFTIPVLIGNIFQQLYAMVDTVIIGQFLGIEALAALGITGTMNFLVLGFVIGLCGGFGIVMSQKFGAQDLDGLRHSIATSIYLGVIFTIVLTVVSLLTMNPLLKAINTPEASFKYAQDFIFIIYLGTFSQILFNLAASILRAIGDSRTPLYFLIISSILNVILDFVLAIWCHMGVSGAALATVISQTFSGLLCVIYMCKKFPLLKFQKKDWRIDLRFWWEHVRLGLPMALQFSITAIGLIILQGAINKLGPLVVAGHTAATKVEILLNQPLVAIGTTMATFTGQNLGANKIDRVRKGVRSATLLAVIFSILPAVIFALFWRQFISMFINNDHPEAFAAAGQYIFTFVPFLIVLGLLFIYRNVLEGIGRPLVPMLAGVMELVMRVFGALALSVFLGYFGICLSEPIAWIGACIPLITCYLITMKKLEKKSLDESLKTNDTNESEQDCELTELEHASAK